jgi:glutathione S-transferase
MKLYDHPLSPYAMKIRAILYEKGIEFEKVEILEESQRDELQRVNPRLEVPALEDGDTLIFDSKVIAEYLEEVYPEPALLPKDASQRAECRALELLADTQLDSAVIAYSMFKFFRPALLAEKPEAFQVAEAVVRAHFADLDQRLAGRDYFLDSLSRADLAMAPHFGTAALLGLTPGADTPQLAAWHARMQGRESIRRMTKEAVDSLQHQPEEPFFDNKRLQWRSDRIEGLLRAGLGPWLLEELAADRAFLPSIP